MAKKFEPGCAFSRSLGDMTAERIGCCATPEVMTHELDDDDVLCVIASDGVWEFLTNQAVIDLCMAAPDPHTACYDIVAAAYKHWYEQEERIDDISVIVMFFEKKQIVASSGEAPLPKARAQRSKRAHRGSHAAIAADLDLSEFSPETIHRTIPPAEAPDAKPKRGKRGSFSKALFGGGGGSSSTAAAAPPPPEEGGEDVDAAIAAAVAAASGPP